MARECNICGEHVSSDEIKECDDCGCETCENCTCECENLEDNCD